MSFAYFYAMAISMVYSLIFSVWLAALHPLHVSVTEIEYDEQEKELEIVTRIFTDDLETAIRADAKLPELDLLNPPAGQTTDALVKQYVLSRMRITLDGKVQRLNFIGIEKDDDAITAYIQVSQVKRWKTITVLNNIIHETYDDQSNIVHVTLNGKVRSLRLMRNNPSGTITF
jgi:hypothetical protein